MNLLRFIKITFLTALISLAATSCLKDSDGYAPDKFYSQATMLLTKENPDETPLNESPLYFLRDSDSTVLYPVNYKEVFNLDKIKGNQRYELIYIVSENTKSSVKSAKEPILIEIINIGGITTLDILQTSDIDSVVNNIPVKPIGNTYSGGVHGASIFLTLSIEFQADEYNPLKPKLVDNLKNTNPTEDGYYQLEFRLSSEKDNYYGTYMKRLISFPLPEKYRNDNGTPIKGLRITYKYDDDGGEVVKDYPY